MRRILGFFGLFLSFAIHTSHLFSQEEKSPLLLYYSSTCPYSKEVLSYLKDNSLTLPKKDVSNNKEAKEELIAKGGKAVVPCLFVGDTAIYYSGHIIQWLEEHMLEQKKAQ